MAAVSEIVLIYRVESYIERCVRSLMEQSFEDIEYIFVNDCTPDRSMDILHRVLADYPDRVGQIRIIENSQNRGAAASRNIGIEAATGDYLIFTDSDDWVESDMVEQMYRRAIEQQCDIVWCGVEGQHSEDLGTAPEAYIRGLLGRKINPGPINKLVRRDLYKQVHYVEKCNNGEDLNVNVKLHALAHKIAYVPQTYYHINYDNEQSITRLKDNLIPNGESLVRNVADIARFMEEQELDKHYERELDFCKVNAKEYLLLLGDRVSLTRWSEIFPEVNDRIWTLPYYPSYTRCLLWLVARGIIWPFRLKEFIKQIAQ